MTLTEKLIRFKANMKGVSHLVIGWDDCASDKYVHFSAIPIADIDEDMLYMLIRNGKCFKRFSNNASIRYRYEIKNLKISKVELDKLDANNRGWGAEMHLFGSVKTYENHIIDGFMEIRGSKHFVQVKCSTNKGNGTSSTNNLI